MSLEISIIKSLEDLRTTQGRMVVPPIVENGKDTRGRLYFVMPWYEAGSLQDMLDKATDLEPRQALLMIEKIAELLAIVHSQGIAHRDVKPSNILIDKEGNPLLTDFGLCLEVSSEYQQRLTATSEAIGSRLYLAPENENGINEDVDQRPSDFYAFAKLAWTLIAGRRQPLARELQSSIGSRLYELLKDSRLAPLDDLCRDLLNPDPRARLCDWETVMTEVRSVYSSLAIEQSESSGIDGPADLLRAARLYASTPLAANLIEEQQLERRAEENYQDLKVAAITTIATFNNEIEEINKVIAGAAQANISQGGPSLGEIATFSLLHTAGIDQRASQARTAPPNLLPKSAWHESSPALVVISDHTQPPRPALYYGMYLCPTKAGVYLLSVPLLYVWDHTPGYRLLSVLDKEYGRSQGPWNVSWATTRRRVEAFATEHYRASTGLIEKWLRLSAAAADLADPAAWSDEQG